jgi:AmmeMemoRadiSam system protein A
MVHPEAVTPEAKRALLTVARHSVSAAASGMSALIDDQLPSERSLFEFGAAFVTLHEKDGAVRGCVGTTVAVRPLVEVVSEMARSAALRDPRFPPVVPSEVNELHIEISVLGQPEPVRDLGEVEIGRHGLLIEGRGRRGLLLPQVASERDWVARTFAEQTCTKAGLDSDAYLDEDVALFRFEAEVFNELDV